MRIQLKKSNIMRENSKPRNKIFTVRITEEEFDLCKKIAKSNNLSRSNWGHYILCRNMNNYGKMGDLEEKIVLIKGAIETIEGTNDLLALGENLIHKYPDAYKAFEELKFQLNYKRMNLSYLKRNLEILINN